MFLSDEVLNKDSNISETFNIYFLNSGEVLGSFFSWVDDSSGSDPSNIFMRISSSSNQPSIEIVKDKYQNFLNCNPI